MICDAFKIYLSNKKTCEIYKIIFFFLRHIAGYDKPQRENSPISNTKFTKINNLMTISFERSTLIKSTTSQNVFDLNNCYFVTFATGPLLNQNIISHSMDTLPVFTSDCFQIAKKVLVIQSTDFLTPSTSILNFKPIIDGEISITIL
jgi:hypothetical protein